jgi:hypothetical protein
MTILSGDEIAKQIPASGWSQADQTQLKLHYRMNRAERGIK